MSYIVEMLPDEPILISTLHADFDFSTEAQSSTEDALALLEKVSEPVYYIADSSKVRFSFDDTIEGSNMAARGDNPLFHHPNVKQVLLVVGDVMQEMSAKGLQSDIFGNVNVKTFASMDEALAHARSEK